MMPSPLLDVRCVIVSFTIRPEIPPYQRREWIDPSSAKVIISVVDQPDVDIDILVGEVLNRTSILFSIFNLG